MSELGLVVNIYLFFQFSPEMRLRNIFNNLIGQSVVVVAIMSYKLDITQASAHSQKSNFQFAYFPLG